MVVVAEFLGGGDERRDDPMVGAGGIVLADVLLAGPLLSYRAGRDDEVADAASSLDRAAGADPDEGVSADAGQFFERDSSRRTADAG